MIQFLCVNFTIGNRQFLPSEVRDFSDNAERADNESRRDLSRELVPINNRHSGQSTSFFAIFYERPVRHRYYRQMNRSATNLVRRLSQSRLFVNPSRAQNAAYRNNYRRNRQESTQTQPEIEPESYAMLDATNDIETQDDPMPHSHESVHSLNIASDINENVTENRLNAMRIVASENDVSRNADYRCETPPPPYNVVAKANNEHV